MEVAQLAGGNRCWSFGHQIDTFSGFGKCDDVADACGSAKDSVESIEAEGDSAVRRSAVPERLEHVPEAELGFVRRDLENLFEDGLLNIGLMNTNGAAAELDTVD